MKEEERKWEGKTRKPVLVVVDLFMRGDGVEVVMRKTVAGGSRYCGEEDFLGRKEEKMIRLVNFAPLILISTLKS